MVLSDEIERLAENTITFLTLATTIGIVSTMNGTILISELKKVQEKTRSIYGKKNVLVTTHPGYANIILNQTMFDVSLDQGFQESLNKGHEINNGLNLNQNVFYKSEDRNKNVLMSISKKIDLGNKIARRNDVLRVVRNKGKVSIKDITEILKDIGDKTIQRELHALVQEGVLVKEGEKRWSTYRIAN
jgi:DNA-binding transcriptional ArsR family regulator